MEYEVEAQSEAWEFAWKSGIKARIDELMYNGLCEFHQLCDAGN